MIENNTACFILDNKYKNKHNVKDSPLRRSLALPDGEAL
jgi:hypothetical protein